MRFHVLGIPHTIANKDYVACAFTQLVIRFCKMMKMNKDRHTIYFYGHEKSEIECDELVCVMESVLFDKFYPKYDDSKLITYGNQEQENIFNVRCIDEIKKRKQSKDFVLVFWGCAQKVITDALTDCIIVEPSIGYPASASFAPYKVFVSYAHMHYTYGMRNIEGQKWYDAVIPNHFDPEEFEFKDKKKNYMLYLGRLIKTKGLDICIQLAERTKTRLIIAGQGDLASLGYTTTPEYVECVGPANLNKRKKLMSNAKCLLLPTYYIEPFGNVVIEAFLSGTPVISTEWGAFNETNLHGITGYRCRTFEQFVWAVNHIDKIDPKVCRKWAIDNFSMTRVADMYEEYFDMVYKMETEGYYAKNDTRENLDWLVKKYPSIDQASV